MSGKASKIKGSRAELEFTRLMGEGARKVPLSGAMGGDFSNDVILPNNWQAEIKRFKAGEKTLYGWIMDKREKPDIVGFRGDKMPWIVAMKSFRFYALMRVQVAAAKLASFMEDGLPSPVYYSEYVEAAKELDAALQQCQRAELLKRDGGDTLAAAKASDQYGEGAETDEL